MGGFSSGNIFGASASFPSITDDGAVVTIEPTNQITMQTVNGQSSFSLDNGGNGILQANAGLQLLIGAIHFFAGSPIAQQAPVTNPSGGIVQDTEARQAIDDLITFLQNYGLSS